MGKLGLRTCVHLLPEELSRRRDRKRGFLVQRVVDAGWEGRNDNIAVGALEDDARGKPSGRW
jgi:hypothetical protein